MQRIVLGTSVSDMHIHALHGPLKEFHAARISQQYRLVFALDTDAVTFIDIGSHGEVY